MHKTDILDKQPTSEEEIDQTLNDSIPASDAPSRTLGTDHRAESAGITTPEIEIALLTRAVNRNDHTQGTESATMTLLMYGSYECPFCVDGNMIVKQVRDHFGTDLRFAFRHFPQTNVHPHAEAAAEVAEAAGEQDKFWEMHETLFENYNRLDGESLISYAAVLDLDIDRFDRAILGRVFAARVRNDLISGIESGVRATPTYFVNGVRHFGSGRFETLVDVIDRGIAEMDEGSFLGRASL